MGSRPHALCGLHSMGNWARDSIIASVNNAINDPVALHLSDLYRTLSDELALHGVLLGLLQEARESIINRSAEKLLAQVDSINTHLPRLDALRKRRDHTRRELALVLSQPPASPFISLIRLLPAELRAHIGTRVAEINSVLRSAQHCLRQNQMLLIRTLEQMDAVVGRCAWPMEDAWLEGGAAGSMALDQRGDALEASLPRRSL